MRIGSDKTCHKAVSLILMTSGCLFFLQQLHAETNFTDSANSYCIIKQEDELTLSKINPNYQKNSPEIEKKLSEAANTIDDLGNRLLTLKRKTVASTYTTAEISSNLPSLRKEVQGLQTTVTDLATKLPTTRRQIARNLIEQYISITQSLLVLELYVDAKSVGMIQFRNQYALTVALPVISKLFPAGSDLIAGTEFTEYQSEKEGLVALIHLSLEEIYRAMVRGAAQSRTLQAAADPLSILSSQYLETARCTLSRMIMGRYEIQKSLVTKASANSSISLTAPNCLGSTAKDFAELAHSDATTFFEVFLRKKVAEKMPHAERDHETLRPLIESDLLEHGLYLYAFPESLAALNNANRPLTDKELTDLNASTKRVIEKFNTDNPTYARVSHLWQEPELQNIFKKIINDCRVKFTDSSQKLIPANELFSTMLKVEEFYFSHALPSDLLSIFPRISALSIEQNKIVFTNYINNQGKLAALLALNVMLGRFTTDTNPSPEDILIKISEDFDKAVDSVQQRRASSVNIKAIALELAELTEKLKTSARQDYLLDFTNTLIKNAKTVNNIMSEKVTPSTSLPYNAKAIIRTLDPTLGQLQSGNRERLEQLAGASSFAEQKSIWANFKAVVEKRAQALNTTCEVTVSAQLKNWLQSFYQEQQATRAASAQRDCSIMNFLAGTLALTHENEPETMQISSDFIKEKYSDSDYSNFFEIYRQQLAGEIIAENRLLDMNVDPRAEVNDPTAQKLYQKLVTDTASLVTDPLTPDPLVLQLVDQSLQRSIESLGKNLRRVVLAKKAEDLGFFITRTRVINGILGENSLTNLSNKMNGFTAFQQNQNNDHIADIVFAEGFNFPNLLAYHRTLQEQMLMREDLTKEIWDEFIADQGSMALAVLGGWAAKHAFGLFPKITGLPYMASRISHVGYKTSYLISGQISYFALIYFANAGYLQFKKSEFNNQLLYNKDLLMADTVKLSTNVSPLPLVSWDQYLNQKIYFQNTYAAAVSERNSALLLSAIPLLVIPLNAGLKAAVPLLENMKRAKNAKFELPSVKDRWLYEGRLKIKYRHRRVLLDSEFKLIDSPKIITLDMLSAGKHSALGRATSEVKKSRINQAYERIIVTYGSDLASIARYPELLNGHARALIGPYGHSGQIRSIINEYHNILSQKGMGGLW